MENKLFSNKKLLVAISLILCAVIAFGIVAYDCFFAPKESSKAFTAMGTVVTSRIWTKNNSTAQEEISNEINALEKSLLSKNVATSDVGRVNADKSASVSSDLADIVITCNEISEASDGALDVSIGAISTLWDFGGDNQRLPSDEEIQAALNNVNYKTISVKGNGISIDNGQTLDLGAVGKGYACDKIKEILDRYNAKKGVVSVGGSLLIYGNTNFTIGIANPNGDETAMGTLELKDCFVSTSGDYEKYFEQDGKKYHHILDPKTGYPTDGYLSSVTVVCDSGLISDALSTACFVLGYKDSLELLKKYDAEAVFIFKDNTVTCTDGISDRFEIINDDYKLNNEADT